jgi:hypothetical protein
MKKFITIMLSILFISSYSAQSTEYAIGITAAQHSIDVDGKEILRESGKVTKATNSEDITIGEVFVEIIGDTGLALGVSYIPVRELGSKSRTDSNGGGDSGTYKAQAELDDLFMVYVDVPFAEFGSNSIYAKVGAQHASVVTQEDLNSGSTYEDKDIWGITLGLGTKADLPYGNSFYKLEATMTDFTQTYSSINSVDNTINADLESTAVKFSLGYKF